MKYLKLNSGDVIEATYGGFIEEREGKFGPQWFHKVTINGEEFQYGASEYKHKDISLLQEGEEIVITKVFSQGKNYVNFMPKDDAMAQAALREKPKGTQEKTQEIKKTDDDRTKEIRFGLSLNCASRSLPFEPAGYTDAEIAKRLVGLAKEIYKEAFESNEVSEEPSKEELNEVVTENSVAGDPKTDLPF